MKKIIISLSVITVVAALGVIGTVAFFSDTETSTGNVLQAGELDLKVDSTCHYDGMVCGVGPSVSHPWVWREESTGSSTYPELLGKDCSCSFRSKDLGANDLFFNFTDIKPGDNGENTVSLHVVNNDAYVCAQIANLTNQENGCNEPEDIDDSTCANPGPGEGELQGALLFTVWRDVNCDNVLGANEAVLVKDQPASNGLWPIADSQTGGPLAGDTTACIGVSWKVPSDTGNIIQSDSLMADVIFTATQSRNNADFRCVPPPEIIPVQSSVFHFSGTGWAGWSCPSSHPNIVSADTTNCTQPLAISQAAKPGVGTYPVYPHYTYIPPEQGWVLQNGGTSQSCYIVLQCQAN